MLAWCASLCCLFPVSLALNPVRAFSRRSHVQRVIGNARRIASAEAEELAAAGRPLDCALVDVLAAIHDVRDHKYAPGAGAETEDAVIASLVAAGIPATTAATAVALAPHVSFSRQYGPPTPPPPPPVVTAYAQELAIVRDADRLDSMGAVGVARTFAYGAAAGRSLSNGLVHFDEKLLRLVGCLTTKSGRAMGRERHALLVQFASAMRDELAWGAGV